MPTIILTDLSIRALKSKDAQVDYWDKKTPGFGVRVGTNRKTFVAKLNNRRITIGVFPDLSLADARRKALALKSDKTAGLQPSVKFSVAVQAFYDTHLPMLKANTQRALKRNLERHFVPIFKNSKLQDIRHKNISDITDALAKSTPSEAWHAFKDARIFFNWCTPRFVSYSPMAGLKSPTSYVPRKRVLDDSEVRAVWLVANNFPKPFGQMLQLCLLTGCRPGEIASLRWSYINDRTRLITLPETKNGQEHTLPYGPMAQTIFASVPHQKGVDLLFPGRDNETPWNGMGKSKWLFNKECQIVPWQILDLRRTFATKLADMGVAPHIVERLINHKLGSLQTAGVITAVAAIYNRALYIDEMRAAVLGWEKRINALLRRSRLKQAA